jgi:Na+(H+)/acetate symporter ActP
VQLDPLRPRRSRSALGTSTRWLIRGVLLAAIFLIAIQRGFVGQELVGVGLAVLWAAALPFLLRLVWKATAGREGWVRYTLIALAAALLLAAFVVGVRPLLRPG